MSRLALQHHILDHAVAVPIQRLLMASPCVQHQLALQYTGVACGKSHIIGVLPAAQILLHRFAVEENHRYARRLRLVDDDSRRRAVHDVDADHVVSPLQKAIHLLVLGGLALLAVGDIQVDLDVPRLLLLQRHPLQFPGHRVDKGVLLLVQRHPDPEGGAALPACAAGGQRQQQRQRSYDAADPFHTVSSPPRVTSRGTAASGYRCRTCSPAGRWKMPPAQRLSSPRAAPAPPRPPPPDTRRRTRSPR